MDIPMNAATNGQTSSDLQAVINDIAALRGDIATLASHLSKSAINATTDAASTVAGQVTDQATRIYGNVSAQAERSTKAISRQIEQQPVLSLLIVFALGFVGSRLLSRTTP